MSTTASSPRFSVRELQAAADALAAGRFATTANPRLAAAARPIEESPPVKVSDPAAPRPPRAVTASEVTPETTVGAAPAASSAGLPASLAPLVRVRAANAGAGASTVALAVADVADAAGIRVRVLDAAAPAWSGLLGATVTELGAAEGWRRGRRAINVVIHRVNEPVWVPTQVPPPPPVDGVDLTLLDAGWSTRELAAEPDAWLAAAPAEVEVLVTRPYGLALSQTETALAGLEDRLAEDRVVVVVVGTGRWSERKFATAGPRLRTAHEQEAVLFTPLLTAKALPGLGPEPLPKQLTNPSQRLLERITTITGPLTANRT